MRKLFYILILMMVLVLAGCGQSADMEGGKGKATVVDSVKSAASRAGYEALQAELPEMGEIHLHTDDAPGDEYLTGWCTVNWIREDGGEGVKAGYAMGFVEGKEVVEVTLPVKIKLRGNSTREVDKKAYTIKFEEEESLLGMEPGRKWALVSNPFDKSLLRPAVGLTYAKALGIEYTPDFRLCKVWLNDDYMGVYTAMEPVEAGEGRVEIKVLEGDTADAGATDFLLERNLGRYEEDVTYIDSSLGMRFEFNEPEEPGKVQTERCYELLATAEEAICSGDHEQYAALIDVDSFVNFYVLQELIKDVDFGEYSTRYYFEDGILHAGPPWDLDLTMGNVSAEKEEFKFALYNNVDGTGDVEWQVLSGAGLHILNGAGETAFGDSAYGMWAATGDYYYWLCRDPWFMELVQQRWLAVRKIAENLAVDNELGENLIDRYLVAYEEELAGNFHNGSFEDGADTGDAAANDASVSDAGNVVSSWCVNEPAHMSEWQDPADDYAGNVEMLRMWLIKRASYMDSQFGIFVYTPALAVL